MTLKLNQLYTSLLDCAGMVVDKEGFVSVKMLNKTSPAMIDGKRLVLPTQEQLMSSDHTNRTVFHPLMENIMRGGESEVITKLRQAFNIRLNYTFAAIGQSLLTLAASVADHKHLSPYQSEMLSAVKDVDEKTVVAFSHMMINASKESSDKSFVNIYLRRKATINGKIYARGGIVTFPMLQELKEDKEKYSGVKLRIKDKAALIQLHEYIFPGCSEPETYNKGSNSDVAPFLDSLMLTVKSLSSKVNDILELFGPLIDGHEQFVFNADWVDSFDNLADLIPQIRSVPMQAGNEGRGHKEATPVAPQPTTLSYQPAPPVNQPSYQQPQQFTHQPVQAAPPAIVATENGITFDSLMRMNPNIQANAAMIPNRFVPQMMHPGMMPPQQRQPSWSVPQMMNPGGMMMPMQPMQQSYNPWGNTVV
jgi:hypothetical protein